MKKAIIILISIIFIGHLTKGQTEKYLVDSATVNKPNIPKGEMVKFAFQQSRVFPGTYREITVYIPAQYDGTKPACVYVNQDGVQFNAPTVLDNLIAQKEIPVTIGVFITPGRMKAANDKEAQDRFNRSYEYDGLGDNYVRFLLEEILPEVEKQKTISGRPILLSKSGNDRAIGGSSSGAIAAFTAAWERPEAFSRVFSAIGTYVGLRGGDRYPTLIRKYEPKPIRVFLQDGTNDLNIYAGDWWMANQTMERALSFAGYEVKHVWGEGAHNNQHGAAVFAEAMRFLWKDYPNAVKNFGTKNQFLQEILVENEPWELVGEGYTFTEGIIANAKGEVYFQDFPNNKTYKVALDKTLTTLNIDSKKASGTAIGSNNTRYTVTQGSRQLMKYKDDGDGVVLADSVWGNDVAVNYQGTIYTTVPDGRERPSKILMVNPDGKKTWVDEGLKFANGICFSPDQTQLFVTESATHWVWAYQIQPDGTLTNKQRFGHLYVRDQDEWAWSDGLKCDRDGRIYVTSLAGIQVLDQLGRVNCIIPTPTTLGQVSNLTFGGPNFDILYATVRDKVYRRKVKVQGANAFEKPVKPPTPRL